MLMDTSRACIGASADVPGGVFVRGLLNSEFTGKGTGGFYRGFKIAAELSRDEPATDDQLKSSSDWNSDQTIKSYATEVIQPYLEIPPDIEASGPDWQAYVHVSSSNIRQFARSVIYQRRKAMKSAVELAMYEIKTLNGAGGGGGGGNAGGDGRQDQAAEALRARVDELTRAVAKRDAAIRALQAEREGAPASAGAGGGRE
ncbi:hypothetical protein THAOC_18412, partial [Thalassiosira oceanica]